MLESVLRNLVGAKNKGGDTENSGFSAISIFARCSQQTPERLRVLIDIEGQLS